MDIDFILKILQFKMLCIILYIARAKFLHFILILIASIEVSREWSLLKSIHLQIIQYFHMSREYNSFSFYRLLF